MDIREYRGKVLNDYAEALDQLDLKSSIWLVGMEVKHYQASNRNDVVRIYQQVCDEMLQQQNTDYPNRVALELGIMNALDRIDYDEDNEFYHVAGNYFEECSSDWYDEVMADPFMRNVVYELAKISQMPDGIEKESMRKAVCELTEAIDDTPKVDDFWRW